MIFGRAFFADGSRRPRHHNSGKSLPRRQKVSASRKRRSRRRRLRHFFASRRSFCPHRAMIYRRACLLHERKRRYEAMLRSIASAVLYSAQKVRFSSKFRLCSGLIRKPECHLTPGRQNGFRPENRRKPAACGPAVRQANRGFCLSLIHPPNIYRTNFRLILYIGAE